jgi:hypothetical protein
MKTLFLLTLLFAATAHSEIYKWSDAQGAVHYVNSPDDIPLRYRAKAITMNYDSIQKKDASAGHVVQAEPVQSTSPATSVVVSQQNEQRVSKRRLGRRAGRSGSQSAESDH